MTRIPVVRIQMVRDSSVPAASRTVSDPSTAADILTTYLQGVDREHFVVLLLDTKNRVVGVNTVAVGSLNSCTVHPREVFKPAILANAYAIIVAHNHPSGNTTPSAEDVAMTAKLVDGGNVLGISVFDHIIVGDGYASLRDTHGHLWT